LQGGVAWEIIFDYLKTKVDLYAKRFAIKIIKQIKRPKFPTAPQRVAL